MFCKQCGAQIPDGAKFCRNCGAKADGDNTAPMSSVPSEANQSKGKKSKKGLVILGAIILLVIIAVIIALNWEGEIDYVGTVKEHMPFEKLPYTYEEVLNQYIISAEWKVREEDDEVHYVDVEGKVNGIEDSELKVTIKVQIDPDDSRHAKIKPYSAVVTDDGERETIKGQDTVDFLYALFSMYDEGEKDLSSLAEDPVLQGEDDDKVNLTDEDTDTSDMDDNTADTGICFYDIPAAEWFAFSKEELMQQLGDGAVFNEYEGGGSITYGETDIYLREDGTVSGISSYELEKLSVDGQYFHADSDEMIESTIKELFGPDYETEDNWFSGGYMSTIYRYPQYLISFDFSRYDGRWSLWIGKPSDEEEEIFGYEEEGDPSSVYIPEPIENYLRLSGSYSGLMGQSSLGIGIYTSQEEGEIEIGTVTLYTEDEEYFLGYLIPTATGVYEVVTDTGEEVILIEEDSIAAVTLDMYVDGQYQEEYWMTEHYQP